MLIIGVGNPLRGDDGVGPEIIKRLGKKRLSPGVKLLDGGTDGLALIDVIKDYEGKIILADAVDMGKKPGEIRVFKEKDVKIFIKNDSLSTHGFGLGESMELMNKLGVYPDLTIIGIQVMDISFHEGFSPEIEEKLEEVMEIIEEYISCPF